jgi:GNAT superfamily N-acetyltransferase
MSFPVAAKASCRFLKILTEEQSRQILELYRFQGWWQASDDDKQGRLYGIIAGSHCFVVAEDEGRIIGMGRAISDGVSDAYIQDLAVAENRRKEGIGKLIVHTLVDRLHADGISWIGLIAEPGSVNIYARAGFEAMSGATPMRMIKEP